MSVDYYLICMDHKEAVFVTDNKGNPFERGPMKYFIFTHMVHFCDVKFVGEYQMPDKLKIVIDDEDCLGEDTILVDEDGEEVKRGADEQ